MGYEMSIPLYIQLQTFGYFLTFVLAFIFFKRIVGTIHWQIDLLHFKSVLQKSLPFALLIILMSIYTRIDGILLHELGSDGNVQAGIYATGFRLLDALYMFGMIFAGLLFPMFSNVLNESMQKVRELVLISANFLMSGVIVVVFLLIFHTEYILRFIYTPDVRVIIPFCFLMLSFIGISMNFVVGTLLTANGNFKELNIIVKGDVDGSIEALSDALLSLSTPEIQVNIVLKGVGAISEADINLASASDAIIIGFQVRPTVGARKLAETEQIDIRLYSIIYKAIEEIKAAMEGMLSPDIEEKVLGTAEIRETFEITKVGTIAGCYVLDGIIKRSSKVRVIRDGIVIHNGTLGSLKRFKDDVKEVKNNYECGLNIDKFNDIQIGDHVEAYEEVEVARKL
jgi:hypothetical protein